MPSDTSRHREQREARFRVRSGTAQRRALSEDRRAGLLRNIDKRRLQAFGVRQLCSLELDAPFAPPAEVGAAWLPELTLLEYAAWRHRDHIVLALLRGGAEPDPGSGCRLALMALPSEAALWLVKGVLQLRFAAWIFSKENEASAQTCGTCAGTGGAMLRWPCGHSRCSSCVWSGVKRGDLPSLMLRCCHSGCQTARSANPFCAGARVADGQWRPAAPEELPDSDWACRLCGYTNFMRRVDCRNCSAPLRPADKPMLSSDPTQTEAMWASMQALTTPAERKADALARWKLLPSDDPSVTDDEEEQEPEERRLQALPPAEAMLKVVGTTRAKRSEALLAAAGSGDVLRLRAAIVGGCDIEASDVRPPVVQPFLDLPG